MLIFNINIQPVSLTPEDVKQLVKKKILKKDFIMKDGKRTWKRGLFDMVRFLNTQLRAIRDQVIPRYDSDIEKEKDKDGLWILKDMRKNSEAEAKALEELLQGDMTGYTLASNDVYKTLTGSQT